MCVFSKISFTVGVRLLFVATFFVLMNDEFLICDAQAQVSGQYNAQGGYLQGASPGFSPQPNFFLEDDNRLHESHPQAAQVAPVVANNASQFKWEAPVNPTEPDVDLTLIQAVRGKTIGNVINTATQSANQIRQTNEVVTVGNSYFESPTIIPEQVLFEQTSLVLPPVPPIYTQPANQTSAASGLLSAYQSRPILQSDDQSQEIQSPDLPAGFQPWWSRQNQNSIGLKNSPVLVSLDSLIQRALENSPHIQVAATQPHIQQAVLLEESARFDWRSFLESTYDDQNDPVGNTLTTGNNDSRLTQQQWHAEGGIRRQTRTGGEFELSQRISTLQNNSVFLVPEDQGNSRLVLNYRQPLLRGRGQAVNESLIVLANINLKAASDEYLSNIQQHLTDLTETYWELVRARSELLQRRQLLSGAEKILTAAGRSREGRRSGATGVPCSIRGCQAKGGDRSIGHLS